MKKLFLPIILILCLALSACGGQTSEQPKGNDTPTGTTGQSAETQPQPQEEHTVTAPDLTPEKEDGGEQSETVPNIETEVSLADIRDKMIEALDPADPEDILPMETPRLKNLYGIDAELVKQSASFVTMSGVFPDEVVLIEAVDDDAKAAIIEKLSARLDEVMVQAQNYDPETYALAQKCAVTDTGNFVTLILSPNYELLSDIFIKNI